jgi:hypothetical protein
MQDKPSITITIPVEEIKARPNDYDLGKYVRSIFSSLKNNQNADSKRDNQADVGKN